MGGWEIATIILAISTFFGILAAIYFAIKIQKVTKGSDGK